MLAVVAPNNARTADYLLVLVPALFLLMLLWWSCCDLLQVSGYQRRPPR